ncbi:cadmium-induced protein AS8 isoform X2 [Malania oleifera]|uniref:cadmium-induced protein AS8 isoform X2 n=1 Tax=Malania oleifera TaxID=397392 RepID=UPI0025ADEEA6|nr:cadmium-induced protein AS8 isoform X2 [Malania oleifera]
MIAMIIKGLFRRYERWNPVHPTSGAFWGMGIGFGCGVGWGPGFGPEVIGYVGAGCGFGFSVGITLAGFGIGLPANCLIEVPYNALMATRSNALEFARSNRLLPVRNSAQGGWNDIASCISGEASGRFFDFKHRPSLDKRVDEARSTISVFARSVLKCIESCGSNFLRPRKGILRDVTCNF